MSSPVRWLIFGILCLVGVIAVIVFGVLIWRRISEEQAVHVVEQFAQQLGYTKNALIARHSKCWDVLPESCGLLMHFTTHASRDEISDLIQRTSLQVRLDGTRDGYAVFSDVNIYSGRRLTWNGNDARTNPLAIPQPEAFEWWLIDTQGRSWLVAYYQLADDSRYKLDNESLNSNIVTVMLQTR